MSQQQLFWLRMFRYATLYVLITGILPTLAIFQSTQEPWRLFFDLLSWPLDGLPAGFSETERQLSAVLGGVLCGWAWLMFKVSQPDVFNQKLRQLLVQSTWVWFIIDSGGSVLAGLPLNAVSNIIFAVVLLVPLWKLKQASA